MSSNKNEYSGVNSDRSCYTMLNNVWTYSCPSKNSNYPGFANTSNCLCQKDSYEVNPWHSGNLPKTTLSSGSLGWKC